MSPRPHETTTLKCNLIDVSRKTPVQMGLRSASDPDAELPPAWRGQPGPPIG